MDTRATKIYLLIVLCTSIPLELVDLITSFLIRSPPKIKRFTEIAQYCGCSVIICDSYPFLMRDSKQIRMKYGVSIVSCRDDIMKLKIIGLFCKALLLQIPVLPYICRRIDFNVSEEFRNLLVEIFSYNTGKSNLPLALKLYNFAIT